MSTADNIIGFVRDLPRLSAEYQLRKMEQHGIAHVVIDGRRVGLKYSLTVEDWDHLLKRLRPGNVLAITRGRVLIPEAGFRLERKLYDAIAAVEAVGTKAKPVSILELENGWRSSVQAQRDMILLDAIDDLRRVVRAERSGRPEIEWTDEETALVERHWFNTKRHAKNDLAAEAICAEAKRLKLPRLTTVKAYDLRNHFGASGRADMKRKPGKT